MGSSWGHCLCGAVTYKYDDDAVIWRGLCHCESCRRACSAPIVGWFGVQKSAWRWTGTEPRSYQSSPHAQRYFCAACGSQIGYATEKLPHEIHGLAASLSDPTEFAPAAHFHHAKALAWLHIADDLPRYLDGGKTLDTNVPRRTP